MEQEVVSTCPSFTSIIHPDVVYQNQSTKIDVNRIPELAVVRNMSDGTQTITFSTPLQKRQVPNTWFLWSSPPFSENPTPPVLFNQETTTLTMTLSVPSRMFGFEIEPDQRVPIKFKAVFLSKGIPVGSITKSVNGAGCARLFAAEIDCTCSAIDEVIITGSDKFAIAQVRYIPYDCNPDSECESEHEHEHECEREYPETCGPKEVAGRKVMLTPPDCFSADSNMVLDFCFSDVQVTCKSRTTMVDVCGARCPVHYKKVTITGTATVVVFRKLHGGCIGYGTIGKSQQIPFTLECTVCDDFNCHDFRLAIVADPCDFLHVVLQPVKRVRNTVRPVVVINCDAIRGAGQQAECN